MLAADKQQLQSSLKQLATALKEKEFNLHHTNLSMSFLSDAGKYRIVCRFSDGSCLVFSIFTFYYVVTVGTQAAVLAGLDITMFIEFNPPGDAGWVSKCW
jgi:hypothetical protein